MDQQPLVCPTHTTQYVGVLLVGIVIGAGASFAYLKQVPASENTYEAGFAAAKKRIEESSFGPMLRAPDDIRTLSGVVTAITGNRITLHTQPMNPFEDPALDDRTVTFTNDTKFFRLAEKDPQALQAENAAFMKKMQGGRPETMPMTPPEPFTRVPATTADIAVGNSLSVTAGENIKTSKEFVATEVQIVFAR